MAVNELGPFITSHYEIHEWRHASAVLKSDFPAEWDDLVFVLTNFRLRRSSVTTPGGRKSTIAVEVDSMFSELGWVEKSFDVQVTVDGAPHASPTHAVDYYKNRVAIEMEWNNKDPFYDRDLNNFRLLHGLDAVSAGVLITRADSLQAIFNDLGRGASFGASTTHMSKLIPRLEGGGAGGCPVLAFGITDRLYVED